MFALTKEQYRAFGEKVANAQNARDAASVDFHRNWFSRHKGLLTADERLMAEVEYTTGYKENRVIR